MSDTKSVTVTKNARMLGNSLAIGIGPEAKTLGIKNGDAVKITIERTTPTPNPVKMMADLVTSFLLRSVTYDMVGKKFRSADYISEFYIDILGAEAFMQAVDDVLDNYKPNRSFNERTCDDITLFYDTLDELIDRGMLTYEDDDYEGVVFTIKSDAAGLEKL